MTPSPQIVTFLWGFGGSAAVEVVMLNQFLHAEAATLPLWT